MSSRAGPYEQETRLVEDALNALERKTGIAGRLLELHPTVAPAYEADAIIALTIAGKAQHFIVECKSNTDRKSIISMVVDRFHDLQEPAVLIAPYVSREMAEYCVSLDLQFIDTQGNAFIRTGGYIHVTGERSESGWKPRQAKGTTNSAGLRIVFALLGIPGLLSAPYRDIVKSAGVSLGAVSATFLDLVERGYILDPKHTRERRFLDSRRLLDEWAINYPAVLRPKLNPQRFSAPDPEWWRNVHAENMGAVWGGEVAAERITNYLKPETQALYVEPLRRRECMSELIKGFRLRPDPQGPVEILDKFWNFPHETEIAPSLLVYADLMATLDPRNKEVAQMILKDMHGDI